MNVKFNLSVLFACATLFANQNLKAQTGAAFFADFQLSGRATQGQATSMTQDAEGNLEIATSNGVVVYDGANTSLVGTGADVQDLEYIQELGKTYAGCDGRIGFISQNNLGRYIFTKIETPGIDNQSFEQITHVGKDVYFQSDEYIVKISNDKYVQKWHRPEAGGTFSGIFNLSGSVFVNVSTAGLYTLVNNGTLKKHAIDDSKIAEALIYFNIHRGEGEVILGTDESNLYLFTGSELKPFFTDRASYISEKILIDGKKIDKNYMALSTFSGGLMVVNMYTGVATEMYNTSTGFPDDKITCMAVDNTHGIWASHDLGLTRIDRYVPVKFFSSYPGLTGRVISIADANGVLYAGCTDGLFWLKTAESREEYENALKKAEAINKSTQEARKANNARVGATADPTDNPTDGPVKTPDEVVTPTPNETKTGPATENTGPASKENDITTAGKKLKKLLEKAKKKVQGGGAKDGGAKSNQDGANSGGQKSIGYNKTKSIFRFAALANDNSNQYVFTKVQGIEGRVKKLITTPNGLLCATNAGLYIKTSDGVRKLYDGEVRDIAYANDRAVFISSSDANIMLANGTIYTIQLKQNHRSLGSVFIESPTAIWLGETNKAIKVTLGASGNVLKEQVVELPATFRDVVTVYKAGDITYLVSSSGLFELDPATFTAKASAKVQSDENEIFHYLINPATNTLFIRSADGWREILPSNEFKPFYLLDVIMNVRYLSKLSNGSVWAINGAGKIYFLNVNSPAAASAEFNVFVRGVSGTNGSLYDLRDLRISHQESEVEIKWGSNFFIQAGGTWYSWKIENWKSEWSPWTRQTSRTFQLPPGNYTFQIRARDVFGNTSPPRSLRFSIEPPFWQTWWFYTIVALALGFAVWMIFRWRNRALIEKQKLLERMVKERTAELAEEKEKTEDLLLNILPRAVAQELKELGQSSVRKHSDSAVMFTDFCDFTKLSKNMTAEELVMKLDGYFRKFDEIVEKYGIEKIKTIGDSYMCAAGVPQPKSRSSLSMVMAALEIINVVENEDTRWKIRVGIHQGGLVSGVVGKKKFAYDIWGDTVNVASRMESSSEPMNINITEQVYEKIKDYFECDKRGEIEAKSLGKTNMYFVRGLKPEFRLNGSHNVPNKEFLALLN